jgi:hypothetical protein
VEGAERAEEAACGDDAAERGGGPGEVVGEVEAEEDVLEELVGEWRLRRWGCHRGHRLAWFRAAAVGGLSPRVLKMNFLYLF